MIEIKKTTQDDGKVIVFASEAEMLSTAEFSQCSTSANGSDTFVQGEIVKFVGFTPMRWRDTKSNNEGFFSSILFADGRTMSSKAYERRVRDYSRQIDDPLSIVGVTKEAHVSDLKIGSSYKVVCRDYENKFGRIATKYVLAPADVTLEPAEAPKTSRAPRAKKS